jgi:O-acetylhomoserine (thiol)-lyase
VFDSADHAAGLFNLQTFGHIYGRLSNPTTSVLEERLASLEGGRGATCTSSGHAAQLLTLFPLMEPGTRVVASNKLYGGSITQFSKTISKFGWKCTFVVSLTQWFSLDNASVGIMIAISFPSAMFPT